MDQQTPDRLTTDEIRALIEAKQISQENLGSLNLSMGERKEAYEMLKDPDMAGVMGNVGIPMLLGGAIGAAAKFGGPLMEGAGAIASKIAPKAVRGLITGVGAKMGAPSAAYFAGKEAEGWLARALGKGAAAEAVPAERAAVRRVTPPFADRVSQFDEVAEQVPRGVQNDFKGRVSIQPGAGSGPLAAEERVFGAAPTGAYSPNVSTGASVDDIADMLTGDLSRQGRTPVMYHGEDGPRLRRSIDTLKSQTHHQTPKRRKPQ